jgi:starch synthase
VTRDLPVALASRGCEVAVLIPSYGRFAQQPGAKRLGEVAVAFAGAELKAGIYELPSVTTGVRHFVVDHAQFAPHGPGLIYTHDSSQGPFATDANKFALFCAAAAAALLKNLLPPADVVHLHDWPAAFFLLLRAYDPKFAALRKIRTVVTIHNLAMQGVRPLRGFESALESWFPALRYDPAVVTDPRWRDCVNPLAAGIRLADAVNTVSPSYAREILQPSDPDRGFWGGEGLEADLANADAAGKLGGILNGCTYPADSRPPPAWQEVLAALRAAVGQWIAAESRLASAHYLADKTLAKLTDDPPSVILTSIGRVTDQKIRLFREPAANSESALDAIVAGIGPSGLMVAVGSGDGEYERFLGAVAGRHDRFLYLNGYSDRVADVLYRGGDLFLMPSSFEPCGISQMLAMRAGQPCVVHGVGGLRDTVIDGKNGFVFDGNSQSAQAEAFVGRVADALALRANDPDGWKRVGKAAASARFSWDESADAYEKKLYGFDRN